MDIFDMIKEKKLKQDAPLAARMRPKNIDEVVGQEHILAKDKLLYRAVKADKLGSLILYGPPGTGKTTLAKVIANTTKSNFTQLNATVAGKKDIQDVVEQAKYIMGLSMKKTILFIDEIHRFNKAQQDALLPHVEDGTLTLIGATTENPYFEVNSALVSRSRIFQLQPLAKKDIITLIKRAIHEDEILSEASIIMDENAMDFIADVANGDARAALNAIELAYLTTERNQEGKIHIHLEVAQECIQKRAIGYDKDGDQHYDTISAFIKSMRGSDPDAAIYYLARMIYAGEDPKFIARRIVICASEDVGNADPNAITVAMSAASAVNFIGMPESQIILAQAVSYVATAPKSNAAMNSIFSALEDVKKIHIDKIPPHLKDAHYQSAGKLGNGVGYLYPHAYTGHYVEQQYLPDEL
ncbi:MAG: replication-associated recombination protein A, partial [Vallitaleaceae bacterium]|nr:replication-associated recombination protein A [Vallitaleaceae bacterium]